MPLPKHDRPEEKVINGWVMRWCERGKHYVPKCFFGFNQAAPDGRTSSCCIHEAEYQVQIAHRHRPWLRRKAATA